MKKILYMLSALMVISACEYEFEIEGQMSDSQTYVRFVPSNESDTTLLFIQATTPLKDISHPVATQGESIQVKVNGSAIDFEKLEDKGGEFAGKVYATTHRFNPGDRLELEATIPGRKTATASTTVPQEFQPKWKYLKDPAKGDGFCFEIEYDNEPGSSGRYAIAVIEEMSYQEDTWHGDNWTGEYGWIIREPQVIYVRNCSWYTPADVTISTLGQDPLIFRPIMLNWGSRGCRYEDDWLSMPEFNDAMAWVDLPGKTARNGMHQIFVICNKDKIEEAHPDPSTWDPDVHTHGEGFRYTTSYRYKLIFYSFDEASYNYQKAQENDEGSVFAGIGLAPASMTYTNIRDGIGVFGAYRVSESDWFKITE